MRSTELELEKLTSSFRVLFRNEFSFLIWYWILFVSFSSKSKDRSEAAFVVSVVCDFGFDTAKLNFVVSHKGGKSSEHEEES